MNAFHMFHKVRGGRDGEPILFGLLPDLDSRRLDVTIPFHTFKSIPSFVSSVALATLLLHDAVI